MKILMLNYLLLLWGRAPVLHSARRWRPVVSPALAASVRQSQIWAERMNAI